MQIVVRSGLSVRLEQNLFDNMKILIWLNPLNNNIIKSLEEIEEIEAEPSLGNGGLGRLAACFLDSIATLDLPGDGVGLNYHLGLFKQVFEYNKQCETPNPWINDHSWLIPTNFFFSVEFKDFSLKSIKEIRIIYTYLILHLLMNQWYMMVSHLINQTLYVT